MDKTVKELEEELKQTKRRNAVNRFLKRMKELNAIPTEYNCELCGEQIYRLDIEGEMSKASCLCSSGSSWIERLCKICDRVVEVIVSYRYHDGHRGHTVTQGRYKVVDFTETKLESYHHKICVCSDCMKLNDLSWRKQVKDQEEVVRKANQKLGWLEKTVTGAELKSRKARGQMEAQLKVLEEETAKLTELKSQGGE